MDLAETKQRISSLARWGSLVLVLLLAAGCIRPVDETSATPTTTVSNVTVNNGSGGPVSNVTPSIPTTPTIPVAPVDGSITLSSADLLAIENYITNQSGQALQLETLTVWWQQTSINPEEILAFSFRNPSGLACVGVAMGSRDPATGLLNVFTGGAACATELGATALVSSWLLVAQIQPITIVATIGELLNADGTVTGATVIFPDGLQIPILSSSITSDRFLHILSPSFVTASEVVFFGQDGTEIRRQRVAQ